jgi:MFS family permease
VKIGERTSAIVGTAALCASMLLFASLQPSTPLLWLIVALALSGFGMGTSMPSTSSIMANEVREQDFGVMSAAQILAMQVGEVAGIQVLATLQQEIMNHRGLTRESASAQLLGTFRIPFLVGAGLAGAALAAALFLRDPVRQPVAVAPAEA